MSSWSHRNGGEEESYESSNSDDFSLFRHFGTMTVDDRPVFDGFYPLRGLDEK